ncbi:beta-ketoacyl synthase chain length factor [Marinimicrobium sp. ABcell2]|uniref:beta-ketoacyl synthase chain length factor n=1 Tax=Marinimicrobium sp. ABcell2 TaxID=3069751 RepID=UPI0027B59EB0|nr:beta-ketoacyl synthase chain length factor [Marinimicrobium sp. ABcell2]MDQ2076979.1 beta-ketoacyl synthase chain length factor [Marinimicrobium sp. ABcell2]
MDLFVSQFAAWAPGLDTPTDWATWAEQADVLDSEASPPVRAVPAMTRRRLTRWGRLALEVATSVEGHLAADAPVIFSSRHGDTQRTQKLLQDLAHEEPLSPTAFSLSVHNAALGLFTIIQRITAPSLALAAGRDTFAQAWVEAQGWLAEGAPQVLLVHCDEPLADFYRPDADEAEMPAALALLLSSEPGPGRERVSLSMAPHSGEPGDVSMMVAFLVWWFGRTPHLEFCTERTNWHWERELELP